MREGSGAPAAVAWRPMSPLRAVALAAAGVTLSSCATGERPYFSESASAPGEETGDPAVDAVLERLDKTGTARFSAEYTILTRFGDRETDATVVQSAPDDRVIKVGDIQFLFDGGRTTTCRIETRDCLRSIEDSRISDVQVTHRFYGEEAAIRLRRDASNIVGEAEASTDEIAGQLATCATLPVGEGTVEYCALDSGPLARLDDADVRIELTDYASDPSDRSARSD